MFISLSFFFMSKHVFYVLKRLISMTSFLSAQIVYVDKKILKVCFGIFYFILNQVLLIRATDSS